MKNELYWIGLLTSSWTIIVFAPEIFGWQHMESFSGLVVRFFLGYCAIILAAQALSFLKRLASMAGSLAKRVHWPVRVRYEAERPSLSPEE